MSVTHPQGFAPPASRPGLKTSGGQDVALVVNQGPTYAAASVFTGNRCKANPVLWSEQVVKDGIVKAVFLNSGGANCYTGPDGFQTTHAVAERVAERLGHRGDRRAGLLHRADRSGQPPRAGAGRVLTRRTTPWPAAVATTPRTRS